METTIAMQSEVLNLSLQELVSILIKTASQLHRKVAT